MRKLAWRLLPLLVLTFFTAFLNRQNVGFTKLQMLADLQMSEAVYGLGASLFFIGYIAFEVPSSLALARLGARLWIGVMAACWGLVTVLMAFTNSQETFYVLRFLLGVAQAGFFPGAIFYISSWFPRDRHVRMIGIFTLGSALGNTVGGAINGTLLDLQGLMGLAGWQWVFIGGGLPTIVLTGFIFAFLPATADQARFMTERDRNLLKAARIRGPIASQPPRNPWAALRDRRVIALCLLDVLIITAFYGITYWLPTVIRTFGVSATVNGFLNAIPWMIGATMLIILPRLIQDDRWSVATIATVSLIGALCFVAGATLASPIAQFVALAIGGACVTSLNPFFWSLATRQFSGVYAAASIATINSIGNLGGFIAQNLMPWMQGQVGSAAGAMIVPALSLGLLGATMGVIAFRQWTKPSGSTPAARAL